MESCSAFIFNNLTFNIDLGSTEPLYNNKKIGFQAENKTI